MRLIRMLIPMLSLAALTHLRAPAQINSPTTPQLTTAPVASDSGIEVHIIDEAGVQSLLAQSRKPLRLFTIVTKYCGGTPNALAYEEYLVKNYPNGVDHWVLVSDQEKHARDVLKRLKELRFRGPVYIIADRYKGSWKDPRKKGTTFRNALCEPCRPDVIGVPYKLLYGQDNQVLMHGYLNTMEYSPQNAGIPADFIGHFLKQLAGRAPN